MSTVRTLPPLLLLLLLSCDRPPEPPAGVSHRQAMRDFVINLSAAARDRDPDFIVIPQNGQELVTATGEPDGTAAADYLAAIDGSGREDLFYGYDRDDRPTPDAERDYLLALCLRFREEGKTVLVTDYCATPDHVDRSYALNADYGFPSFAADRRALDHVPAYPAAPYAVHTGNVTRLADARNFLYLLDGDAYPGRAAYLDALAATDYDLLLLDLYQGGTPLTAAETARLRTKAGGGTRLLVCYLSIGEAEDYRYYWQPDWRRGRPEWLERENPDWEGNYKVRYWDPAWQRIIYGDADSYLARIQAAGFDGVYLDIVDAFEYFE